MRTYFNTGYPEYFEVVGFAFMYVFLLGAGGLYARNEDIMIEAIYHRLGERARMWLVSIVYVAMAVTMAVIFFHTWKLIGLQMNTADAAARRSGIREMDSAPVLVGLHRLHQPGGAVGVRALDRRRDAAAGVDRAPFRCPGPRVRGVTDMRAKYLFAAALLGLSGLATAAEIVMRLGNDVAPASIQAQANELFAAEVAKRDVGIEIKVFHTNQLGTGVQQIQNVKLGVQEMVNTGYELFDVFASGLKIGSAPFTFVDRAHFENWVRSSMFDDIQVDLIKNGNMRFINMGVIWRRGPYRVMIAKHPIMNLDELSEAKLRVWEAEPVKRFWGKGGLGATVVVLPLADVYLGLRQGVVDAINMPMDLVVPMKFAEVGKHIMNTREYPQFVAIAMNENSWQSLNDAQRQAIMESVDVAGQFYNDQIAGSLETWQKQIVEMGATMHDVDRQPFIDKMRELHKKWEDEGYWQEGTIEQLNALAK